MKIITLTAENIKRLSAVEIKPDGSIVQVTGKNGSGKSSVLDAIYYALAGGKALPKAPIRRGSQTASVRLDLGEIKVTRKFTETATTLVVESADGARFPSPQKMLDGLVGAISFDPLEFARLDAKEQFDTLRRISKVEINLDAIAGKNAADYEARTEVNRTVKGLRAQADAIVVPAELPAHKVDIGALLDQMATASDHNAAIDRAVEAFERGQRLAAELRRQAGELEARAVQLRAQAEKAAADCPDAPEDERVDVLEIRKAIDRAEHVNDGIEARDRKAELLANAEKFEAAAKDLTATIEARNKLKDEALAAATMPIEGIGLGDGVVLFNGLPFDQASSAEQLRISVAIAMAANPKLRVLRIKDGGLLDVDGMRMLEEMATAGDYQVWIETVHATGPVAVEMVDGAVAHAGEVAP